MIKVSGTLGEATVVMRELEAGMVLNEGSVTVDELCIAGSSMNFYHIFSDQLTELEVFNTACSGEEDCYESGLMCQLI